MQLHTGSKMLHNSKKLLLLSALLCSVYIVENCNCPNKEDCNLQDDISSKQKEVFVFSNEETDVQAWSWKSITTLIVSTSFDPANESHISTMCVAHSKKKKFGFTVDMTLNGKIDLISNETREWTAVVQSKQAQWQAEVVVINLLPYFKNDVNSSAKDHENLAVLLKDTKSAIRKGTSYTVQIACIVPWRPPCSEIEEECDFTKLSSDGCDLFIINPESFTDLDGVKCIAMATIPFSKLLYGISEYNAHHIPNKQIILGVPWHGYDYICKELINDVCSLNHDEKCHFADRKMMSHAEMMSPNLTDSYKKKNFNDLYNAPFLNYKKGNEQHQVWFEDPSSLVNKYRLVHELELKGIGVMYGDDLISHVPKKMIFDDQEMWSWVNHEIILETSKNPPRNDFHYADTVAGVAVGCLLLGTVLGFLFTCLALRKGVKKSKAPFASDRPSVEEFVDEDPNL